MHFSNHVLVLWILAECPGKRAAAVHWMRTEIAGVTAVRAIDFGFFAMMRSARASFAAETGQGQLPEVTIDWERMAPLPADVLAFRRTCFCVPLVLNAREPRQAVPGWLSCSRYSS